MGGHTVMTRVSAIAVAAIVVGASLAGAQTPSEIQKPGPAQQKLNYFAGTWRLEVHMKASPFGPRAFFATEHNEWMPGGLLLVSRQEGETPAVGGLAVMGYNTQEKAYTYHVVKSTGEVEDLKGTLEDHTWTWTGDGSGAAKTRLTIKEVSPVSYALKLETASEGRDWSTVMEGRATKALADARQDVAYRR
jgi:hypothetical protein